jgi:hypothetical protein
MPGDISQVLPQADKLRKGNAVLSHRVLVFQVHPPIRLDAQQISGSQCVSAVVMPNDVSVSTRGLPWTHEMRARRVARDDR